MSRFKRWSEHEYGITPRIAATILAGVFFVLFLPMLIITTSLTLDILFNLPTFFFGLPNLIIGGLIILTGATFALWSIYAQITIGRGTPLPIMATQELLISPPFSYCRNPMSLGTIVLYLGITFLIGSITAIFIVILLSILLIYYLKRIEEPELEERFGDDFNKYKERVPFLIPWVSWKE